jgi:hypothetical protein
MIVSVNSTSIHSEFDLLIRSTISELNDQAQKFHEKISTLSGRSLEPYVKDVMTELAIGTAFENSIELIGGQKFPDIVAKKFYGVEVKTTIQNHWRSTGNSVLETTRVESVERIFMLFAKLVNPIEFRCRPYEEVLSEVVVTHSPRYLIDMNLKQGETIFDKIEMPYDILRKKDNPIKSIIEHYKSKLKKGEELWWIGQEDNGKASNIVVKIWNSLPLSHRHSLIIKSMAYFPELFGNSSDKFGRMALWLITSESVVCPNVRDLFSAGGKGTIIIKGISYWNVPRIFLNLFENISQIVETIVSTPAIDLSDYWKTTTTEKQKLMDWIELVNTHAEKGRNVTHLDIKQMLTNLILT